MISIALYKPDIPQNTASILRLCACFGIKMHIIEPCGFNFNDARFKRVIMDYNKLSVVTRYESLKDLIKKNKNSRIILMSTKSKKSIYKFKFRHDDIILLGRESKGVPDYVHYALKDSLKIGLSAPFKTNSSAVNVTINMSPYFLASLK